MKNTILIILFFSSLFIVNVIFYYSSEDYQNFLRKMKGAEPQISETVNENIWNEQRKPNFIGENVENTQKNTKTTDVSAIIPEPDEYKGRDDKKTEEKYISKKAEISLGPKYEKILSLFASYDLSPIELNANLFDLTNEYPDPYLEYYSKELTLYFFSGKTYRSVSDVFWVLALELPFVLNETNDFGENSFYINLDKDVDDDLVRLVINYEGVVFWIKFIKKDFSLVKNKLDTL